MIRVDITALLTDGRRIEISASSDDRRRAVSKALDQLPTGAIPLATLVTDAADFEPV